MRALLPPLLALAPNAANLGRIYGIHWYLAYAFMVLCLAEEPRRLAGRAALVAFGAAAAFTSPMVVVALPVLLWRLIAARAGAARLRLAVWTLAVAAHVVLHLLVFRGADAPPALAAGEYLRGFSNAVWHGTVATTMLGERTAAALYAAAPRWAGWAVGWGALALLGVACARARNRRVALPLFMTLVFAIAAFGLRGAWLRDYAAGNLADHSRYFTLPTLLSLTLVFLLVSTWLAQKSKRLQGLGLLLFVAGVLHLAAARYDFQLESSGFDAGLPHYHRVQQWLARGLPGEHVHLPGYANADAVYTRAGNRTVLAKEVGPDEFFVDLKGLGADRYLSPWFGWFSISGWPRIRHPLFGEITCQRVDGGRYTFTTGHHTGFWTSPSHFPQTFKEWIDAEGRIRKTDAAGLIWILHKDGSWYATRDDKTFWRTDGVNWERFDELP